MTNTATKSMNRSDTLRLLRSLTTQRTKLDRKIADVQKDALRFERIKLARTGVQLRRADQIRVGSSVQTSDGSGFSRVLSIGNLRFNVDGGFNRTLFLANGDERRVHDALMIRVHGER